MFEYGLKYIVNLRHLIAFGPEPGYLSPEGSNFMVKSDVLGLNPSGAFYFGLKLPVTSKKLTNILLIYHLLSHRLPHRLAYLPMYSIFARQYIRILQHPGSCNIREG